MPSIGIYGPSGHGKSTAIKPPGADSVGLDPKETFIIGVDSKPLPFRGWRQLYPQVLDATGKTDWTKSHYFEQDSFTKPDGKVATRYATNAETVLQIMKALEAQPHIKNGVVDTLTHLIVSQAQGRALETGYQKFTELALSVYNILDYARKSRINWFILMHSADEYDAEGIKQTKIQSVGKLLDRQVNMASMFTTLLHPELRKNEDTGILEYGFRTQTNGNDVTKSPFGALPEFVANDYGIVLKALEDFENSTGNELPY